MKDRSYIQIFVLILFGSTLSTAQWTKISFPTTENLWKVRFANENIGWIAGGKFIYYTTNGGTTWNPQDTSHGSVFAMAVINEQIMMYSNYTVGIRRTTNGGTSWATVDTNKHYYDDLEFVNDNIGYVCGGASPSLSAAIVRKTTDGGTTWFTVSQTFPKTKTELTGIAFASENIGWTVTYDGFVYKTINGGIDWLLQDSLGFYLYRDIGFFGANYGWIVGGIANEQKLAYTTNGGSKWIPVSQNGSSIREVDIVDMNNAWFGGSNNFPPYIAHLDSVNSSWKTQDVPDANLGVESIDMMNSSVGYAVGSNGKAYKTITGGIVSVAPQKINSEPNSFVLQQNYPNPFNPTTSIEYYIPKDSYIKIVVSDVLGREIKTLVDEKKSVGSYKVQFDANNLPSGIYFYHLQTTELIQTKKLILLK